MFEKSLKLLGELQWGYSRPIPINRSFFVMLEIKMTLGDLL